MNSEVHTLPPSNELVRQAARGDKNAFRGLVERHRQYAYALAFRIVCDADDARDVVQEAFIRVWRHAERFTGETKFTTWLYTIVTNIALDMVRAESRKRRLFTVASHLSEESISAARSESGDPVSNRDLAAWIRRISDELPPRQRMVFVLRDLQDLSIAEVALILQVSESSVKTNLCYARRHIRMKLEQLQKRG
jgi:RNA polymerase sigma-70 factor (ECF subfamily)